MEHSWNNIKIFYNVLNTGTIYLRFPKTVRDGTWDVFRGCDKRNNCLEGQKRYGVIGNSYRQSVLENIETIHFNQQICLFLYWPVAPKNLT